MAYKDKEKQKAKRAEWKARNPEKVKASNAKSRMRNPEKVKATAAVWRARPLQKQKRRAYNVAYYLLHRAEEQARCARRRATNPDEGKIRLARWRALNPEKVQAAKVRGYLHRQLIGRFPQKGQYGMGSPCWAGGKETVCVICGKPAGYKKPFALRLYPNSYCVLHQNRHFYGKEPCHVCNRCPKP
jgi:hypothetical protein